MSDLRPSITFPPRSKLHMPGVYPMGSPRPTGPVDPLYAGCYFPAPFIQNDGSDFNHTGNVFGVYSADFVELNWKKQLQVDLFGKPRKLFFTNFSWQDGDVLKETSREQIAKAYFAFDNESKRWNHLVYLCQDSLLNDPHPICTRAQLDGLEKMEKEVSERKYHLNRFCDYLNKLEWEYKYPPRWVPTSCDLDAVVSHRASYPPAEREAMITTTLAFRLVEAVDQITSVAWYPAWVQSLILTTGV
ncbi:hypothetical protein JCM24511_06747 [Saitozyma sp. JCM 24511]|nr:hypothetical protein JCM24511_06747 [Saitozyma sp. JCM 24511]